MELLVVASIMAVLFGLVTAGLNPGAGSQVKATARSLVSVIASAQSQAIGNPAGAAVILEAGTAAGLAANMCVRVFDADSLPHISGITTGSPAVSLSGPTTAVVRLAPDNASPEDLFNAYLVQFGCVAPSATVPVQPASVWFTLACTGVVGEVATCGMGFRTSDGYASDNTLWPESTKTGTSENAMAFRAARYPVRGNVALQCGKLAAIDLRYSGIGDDPAAQWGSLGEKGAIAIRFDSLGRVDAVIQHALGPASVRTTPPVNPAAPIYLFMTSREDIATNVALASRQAMWIVLQPQTGRVSLAPSIPQAGSDATALRAARFNGWSGNSIGR